METRLTKEEMVALEHSSVALDSMAAARSKYLLTPGREVLAQMHAIYERVTGSPYTETDACGHCQLKLISFITKWYDDTLAAEAAEEEEIIIEEEAAPKAKPTKKKGGKK